MVTLGDRVIWPDETPERAARWIAQAHPQARRKLFAAYVSLYREEDPDFDLAAFTALVRRELQRRRDAGELLLD